MIPGLGAGVRLARGIHQKKQLEERIEELTTLNSTPAVSHYQGLKRFEVATLICDAQLGLAIDGRSGDLDLRDTCDHYLDVLEREYEMVREQATGAVATKAEVYALGLALKEVALSFDEASSEFTTKSDRQIAKLRAELEGNRRKSSDAMAEFSRAARAAIDEVNESGRGKLSELDERATARLAALDQGVQDRLVRIDTSLERESRDAVAALEEVRSSAAALMAEVERRVEAVLASAEAELRSQTQKVEASTARAQSQTAAGFRSLKIMIMTVGLAVFVAAVVFGQVLAQ